MTKRFNTELQPSRGKVPRRGNEDVTPEVELVVFFGGSGGPFTGFVVPVASSPEIHRNAVQAVSGIASRSQGGLQTFLPSAQLRS